jgi:hypothetical protein
MRMNDITTTGYGMGKLWQAVHVVETSVTTG